MKLHRVAALAMAAVFAVAVSMPVVGPLPAAQAQFNISEQQEIQIGHEVEAELAQKPGFVNDPAELQYVTGIALRMAKVSERPNLPWTYHILNDGGVNAMAAPGGFIFVTEGMLKFVQNVNELGFVLGHETTHVAHRHAVDLAQKDMQLQFGAAILTQVVFGGSMAAGFAAQIARSLIDAKYSREKELEADHYGVIYEQKAGMDPTAALTFMERLGTLDKKGSALTHAFEDHPDTAARVVAIRTELRQMGYQVAGPVTATPAPPPAAPQPAATPSVSPARTQSLPGIDDWNR